MTTSIRRKNIERDFRHGMRGESAARCIGEITKGCEVFGLTKGDFSMCDILRHVARQIGACHVDIATWTAGQADIKEAFDMLNDGNILSTRWLVDRSFPNRQQKYFDSLRDKFGHDCIRLAKSHAKFILLENEDFSVAIRCSMNLNMNKRIEFFEISEGSPISGYLKQVMDYHFEKPMEDSYSAFKEFTIDEPVKEVGMQPMLGDWA